MPDTPLRLRGSSWTIWRSLLLVQQHRCATESLLPPSSWSMVCYFEAAKSAANRNWLAQTRMCCSPFELTFRRALASSLTLAKLLGIWEPPSVRLAGEQVLLLHGLPRASGEQGECASSRREFGLQPSCTGPECGANNLMVPRFMEFRRPGCARCAPWQHRRRVCLARAA